MYYSFNAQNNKIRFSERVVYESSLKETNNMQKSLTKNPSNTKILFIKIAPKSDFNIIYIAYNNRYIFRSHTNREFLFIYMNGNIRPVHIIELTKISWT